MSEPARVSIAEAAARSGVTERTIRNWIAEGRVRAVRLGPKLIRVEVSSLEELATPLQPVG